MALLKHRTQKVDWYVARDYGDSFTITTNQAHAFKFPSVAAAEDFNTQYLNLGRIDQPFDIV